MRNSWRALLPWTLSGLVSVLAVIAWGQGFGWQWSVLNSYLLFPVLGLLAFSIMWSHYVVGTFKNNLLRGTVLDDFYRYTGYAVLFAIIFHPGILVFQLFNDGYGLPPGSYKFFVGQSMQWLTTLGTISLLAFLAFELRRWFSGRDWWKYVSMASDAAMLAIFYHGLRLGAQPQTGWYHYVWLFFGITLVAVLVRKYILLTMRRLQPQSTD